MITSSEHIKNQLTELVICFPEIRARYDNDYTSNLHLIEIIPNETYHNKSEFKKLEEEIIFNFIDLYPFENIVFLSGDDDFKLQKVDFEIAGIDYNKTLPTGIFYTDISYKILNADAFSELFKNYYIDILSPKLAIANLPGWNEQVNTNNTYCHHLDKHYNDGKTPSTDNTVLKEDESVYKNAGDNNYALAA